MGIVCMAPRFIHLRLHTEYSLSDGLLSIPVLMKQISHFFMPSVAISDLGNLYATVKFYQAAISEGIKPIIGVDIQLKETGARLTLLCQNNTGYQNLLKLVSKSYLEGQIDGKPTIQLSWLSSLADGLIALSGAEAGDIGMALLSQEEELAVNRLNTWKNIFPNRFYIEISRVGKPREQEYISLVLKLAATHHIPIVATNDVRFLTKEDFEAHEARVCIQESVTLNDPRRVRRYTDQQYLRSQEEMCQLFSDVPAAIQNTVEIAKRCNVTFELGVNRLPHYTVPSPYTTESYLSFIAKEGLDQRLQTHFNVQNHPGEDFAEQRQAYDERLARELAVINKMGFAGYFLIVADFTRWAKENGIPVGPGRGSGPGSLVAYALKITDLDPLAFDLLFERFLNPERVSMPDFDIDFCMEGRDKVIEYVINKHGSESVSQIMTYGTMAAKAVVRDVGRVLALGYGFVDKIAKLIPFELGITLEKALEQEPILNERYEQEEDVRTLIDLARKLEGITRNVGKHAGGIVIAPGKLIDFVPLYCESHESHDSTPAALVHPVTQFDKDDVELVGLVKFDFLGLKTLTIIDRALNEINSTRKLNNLPAVDINLIPLDDTAAFDLLKACHSTAVFQLESHGMRDLIKRLQPDCFEDLIALVALFRPGPLQSGMVDDFINRKHGRAKVTYLHPLLESILRPTYGVIVYQEQVMQIAQVLAGYTLGAADILRRAMGKKKPEEMTKQREIFCKGCLEHGVSKDTATHIFDLMEKFAGYGFNKSHSASYALIAYQTAWLKAHYPAAFMAAVLSSDMDRTEKIIILLNECEAMKLHVSPPDINKSDYFFKVLSDQHLMYGLGAIKGLGEAAIENIIHSRNNQGEFTNIFDFCKRIDLRKINKRGFEVLIKSGCLDNFHIHRASLLATLPKAIQYAEQALRDQLNGQQDLLAMETSPIEETIQYIEIEKWPEDIQLQGEKETLGFYLTGHPLNQYLNELSSLTTCKISELDSNLRPNVYIAGIITNVRIRQTKRGDRIAVLSLEDGSAQIQGVCFSECFQKNRGIINNDQIVIANGDVDIDEFSNKPRIVCRDLMTIDMARQQYAKYLQIDLLSTDQIDLSNFKQILNTHNGNCSIVFKYLHDNIQAKLQLGKKWQVNPSQELMTALQSLFNNKSIELIY
jgi:DNA polymerase-3 subunit alpha